MNIDFFPTETSTENTELYLTFSLSGKKYAILAEQITEIIQLPALSVLEKLPEHYVGLMNLRGKVVSVIDIRTFLGIELFEYTTEHQVLLVKTGNKTVGIIVDTVDNVLQLDRSQLEILPYNSNTKYIYGLYNLDNAFVAFVNIEQILNNLELQEIDPDRTNFSAGSSVPLFPTDPDSQQKLAKRALNLQKTLRVEVSENEYLEDRFVSFNLNNEIYCISLKYVKEFTKLKNVTLTKIPCVPEFIAGLINLRGEFITIIDIKSFLGIQPTEISDKTKIIVVKSSNLQVGILVDDVFDMVSIPIKNLNKDNPASYEKDKFTLGEIIRDDKTVMSVLNLEKLLEDERLYLEEAV